MVDIGESVWRADRKTVGFELRCHLLLQEMLAVSPNQIFPRVIVPAADIMALSVLTQKQAGWQTLISSYADSDDAMSGTLSFG